MRLNALFGSSRPLEAVPGLVETVAHDVKQGYVLVEAAADPYGVVVDPTTFEIDRTATEQLRQTA